MSPPQHQTAIIVDDEDSSEECEAEFQEDPDGNEEEEPPIQVRVLHYSYILPHQFIQFETPRNILQDHWARNGRPQPTHNVHLTPLTNIHPTPSANVHPAPSIIALKPPATRPRPKPVPAVKRDVPFHPAPEVVPLGLPPPDPSQQSIGQSFYPLLWRKFLVHAEFYILRDIVYTHPFPNATELWVAEAVSTAFKSWGFISTEPLCPDSCASKDPQKQLSTNLSPVNAHRSNLVSLVSKVLFFHQLQLTIILP